MKKASPNSLKITGHHHTSESFVFLQPAKVQAFRGMVPVSAAGDRRMSENDNNKNAFLSFFVKAAAGDAGTHLHAGTPFGSLSWHVRVFDAEVGDLDLSILGVVLQRDVQRDFLGIANVESCCAPTRDWTWKQVEISFLLFPSIMG